MRLIDADSLKEWAEEYHASNWGIPQDELIYAIGSAPTIEPKRGKWIEPTREGCLTYDKTAYAECSECGKKEYLGWGKNYCPNCGTMMKGDVVVKGEKDESLTEAAEDVNGHKTNISRACADGRQYKGFTWRFAEERG